MGTARLQHAYKMKSGLPVDDIVNTWYFASATEAVSEANATDLVAAVFNFYDAIRGGAGRVNQFIAESQMAAQRHQFKVYDMDDPEPRQTVYELTTAGGSVNEAGTALPGEVALCMSYRGPVASGVNMARRRGRLFLGPLRTTAAVAEATTALARPSTSFTAVIIASAEALTTEVIGYGWNWIMHSPSAGDYWGIQKVHVDNSFDTIRKRGCAPTSRVESIDLVNTV